MGLNLAGGLGINFPTYVLGSHSHYATNAIREKKSRKILYYLTGLVFAMVGCTYAAVPLYRRFCQATGYGGTVQRREVCTRLVDFSWIETILWPSVSQLKDCKTCSRWKSRQ